MGAIEEERKDGGKRGRGGGEGSVHLIAEPEQHGIQNVLVELVRHLGILSETARGSASGVLLCPPVLLLNPVPPVLSELTLHPLSASLLWFARGAWETELKYSRAISPGHPEAPTC